MSEGWEYALFLLGPLISGGALLCLARYHHARATRTTFGPAVLGNVLVGSFLSTSVFLMSETYYRFVYDTTDSINQTKVSQRWFGRYFHLNRAGCRDDVEYAAEVQPGIPRISFVGDSFTVGQGIKSVKDRFANRIRAAHPEWEIHVLANLGDETGNEIENMRRVLRAGYQLDRVVLVYCLNDIADLIPEWEATVAAIVADAQQQGWFLRHSYFANLMYYRIQTGRDPLLQDYFGFVRDQYRGVVWAQQQERLRRFRALVVENGGRLAVVTFPFLNALGPDSAFRFVHVQLGEFWRALEVPHLDLTPVYTGRPWSALTVNRHDAHPNEVAHGLAAEAIEGFLKGQVGSSATQALSAAR
jgi:hypothetical protein